MSPREVVDRAVRRAGPDRVPVWMFNRDQLSGDIYCHDFAVTAAGVSEWGYSWKRFDDGTMGQPEAPVLPEWGGLAAFKWPDPADPRRLAGLAAYRAKVGDRYRLATMGITGFNTYTFIRGFENAMVDFLAEPEPAGRLLDGIMSFETELFALAAREGFDGVHLADDWGTQSGLMVSPELWREFFKPRYRRQVERAHELGLQVWLHSCGNIAEIVPDLSAIGMDVINISQPNAVDTAAVGRGLRGRQCFMVPISYQTVSISGTAEQIRAEARRLHDELAGPGGGFIGYVEDYACMGMSESNYQACIEAFRSLRAGR
jgi:uroporphyrinogen decarboxylase